ncbi:protein arginine kinase [Clostridiisalibacter paucivorans]|uniref:protein arginine kinase n=1 Tax=Clostridiisalibacter paucivorans TaxID=408753 RepID=UPI00047A0AA9|nr:protein arginine kinase [Clostridiisalibacter paucivorans]
MVRWLDGESGTNKDVVISSRIRLARNIEGINFTHMMNDEESKNVIDMVKDAVSRQNVLSKEFEFFKLSDVDELNRKVLVEEHLISPALLNNTNNSAFLLSKDQKATIMINEEDHIRMQILLPGLSLEKGWDMCDKLDDALEESVEYGFDERLGYLTSCPTNIGTGLRASVMVHLPCLVLTKQANPIVQTLSQIGLTVRGLYGEGTNAMGNVFQISNQTTLGNTEEGIIKKLKRILLQIIEKEQEARKIILENREIEIEDKIWRSLGILKNARIMSSKEAMKLLSDVKLGIEMGIIKDMDHKNINELMIITQPASIQKEFNSLSSKERDIHRAQLIRDTIDN